MKLAEGIILLIEIWQYNVERGLAADETYCGSLVAILCAGCVGTRHDDSLDPAKAYRHAQASCILTVKLQGENVSYTRTCFFVGRNSLLWTPEKIVQRQNA